MTSVLETTLVVEAAEVEVGVVTDPGPVVDESPPLVVPPPPLSDVEEVVSPPPPLSDEDCEVEDGGGVDVELGGGVVVLLGGVVVVDVGGGVEDAGGVMLPVSLPVSGMSVAARAS